MKLGLGRSIYSESQMREFYTFQNAAGARNAFLADKTKRAYGGMSDGEWVLSLGEWAKEMMIDHVGWSFIPLYQIFGPPSMLFIMLIFVVGLLRFMITLLVTGSRGQEAAGCGCCPHKAGEPSSTISTTA